MPEPDTTPAACGFRHDEWDGPYRMPRRCIASAGHSDGQFAYDHGPWETLPLNWVDPPADGTTPGTSGRTETADTTPAVTPSGFTWAQSVASYGTGPTVTIDIDIHAPGHDRPVPVEIPLADARTLHDMLSGVLAEHDKTRRGPCLCGRQPDPGICPGGCTSNMPSDGHCRCACTTTEEATS